MNEIPILTVLTVLPLVGAADCALLGPAMRAAWPW